MPQTRRYQDDTLNRHPHDRLEPERANGVLLGLRLGKLRIPRPACGNEHEHNIFVRLPASEQRMPDDVGVQFLLRATAEHGARSAYGWARPIKDDAFDRGRLILPGPGRLPVHVYDDCSKLETSYGEFTSAKGLLAFWEALNPELREIVRSANEMMEQDYNADPSLLVHLSGHGGGKSTCASLHLNIPWADSVAKATYVTLEAFGHLEETLVRQLAIMTGLAATGMPVAEGMLSDPRCSTFAQIVGFHTLEPSRAMQFNRYQGRPNEGCDRKGQGRNMQMLATWGQSQAANFLTVVLNQMETVRLHLAVAGLHVSRKLLAPEDGLLALAVDLATNRKRAARLGREALDDYVALMSWLVSEVGPDVVEELIPDYQEALGLADGVLTALEQDDLDTLVSTTDYAKKSVLIDTLLRHRQGTWRDNLPAILNVCAAFSSTQEISPLYTYFRPRGLDTQVVTKEEVSAAGPDPATRGYFFAEVVRRFWNDQDLDDVAFDWNRLVRRRRKTLSGGWIPNIHVEEQIIEVPASLGHNQATIGDLLRTRIASLDDLFEVFGSNESQAAAVAASA